MFSLIFQHKGKWEFTSFLHKICNKTILILNVTATSFKINYTPSSVIWANNVAHNLLVTYSIGFTNGNGPDAGLHSNKHSTMDNPKRCRYAYKSLLPWTWRLQFLLKLWLTSYKTVWCHKKESNLHSYWHRTLNSHKTVQKFLKFRTKKHMFKSKLEFCLQLISKASDLHRPNYNNREHAVTGKVYDAVNITSSDITDHYTTLCYSKFTSILPPKSYRNLSIHLLKSDSNVIRIDKLSSRLHDSTKQTTSFTAPSTHHFSRTPHHIYKEAYKENMSVKTTTSCQWCI